MTATVHEGDCLETLAGVADATFEAVVTDPPYGLSFMGKGWDHQVPGVPFWSEFLRVAKPGAHLLAFGGTRTWHRMAVAIEDAGWEIRDTMMWLYGSGFPKSHNIGKAIDKVNGETGRLHKFTAWMRTTGLTTSQINEATGTFMGSHYLTAKTQPAIPTRAIWATLRPMCGDVPAWVDELVERIEAEREVVGTRDGSRLAVAPGQGQDRGRMAINDTAPATDLARQWEGWGTALKPAWEPIILARKKPEGTVAGNVERWGCGGLNIAGTMIECPGEDDRWPANLMLGDGAPDEPWARYFYQPKASKADRNSGDSENKHPTVKPTDLMRYLCRLVTPPGGTVLDPFTGSGSTGKAAVAESFNFFGCELSPEYAEIARARITHAQKGRATA